MITEQYPTTNRTTNRTKTMTDYKKVYIEMNTAAAIINDDYTGTEDHEQANIDKWTDSNMIVGVNTGMDFARCDVSGLMADCGLFVVEAI